MEDNQNSKTAGERGPVLLEDCQLIENTACFTRERVPGRVVHATGSGACGVFRVTGDITATRRRRYCLTSVWRRLRLLGFPPWQASIVPSILSAIRKDSP